MNNATRPIVAWFRVSVILLLVIGLLLGFTTLAGAQPLPPHGPDSPTGVIHHACPDSYEALSDDLMDTTGVTLTAGVPQSHNFDGNTNTGIGDKDWVRFPIVKMGVYTITTSNLSPLADTELYLLDADGNTIAHNDDSGAADHSSQIVWHAPPNAVSPYYVMARNNSQSASAFANCTGTVVSYTLSLQSKSPAMLFLPVLLVNF
jgi:hypothetical protein